MRSSPGQMQPKIEHLRRWKPQLRGNLRWQGGGRTLEHATSARNVAGLNSTEEETIVLTQQMAEVLKDAPMISCK